MAGLDKRHLGRVWPPILISYRRQVGLPFSWKSGVGHSWRIMTELDRFLVCKNGPNVRMSKFRFTSALAGVELVVEDGPRERRLERLSHEALERPRAVGGVEAAQRQLLDGVGFDLRVFAHMFGRLPVDASGRVSRRGPPTATPGAWR